MFLVLILFNLGPKERIRPHMGTPVPAPVLCQCLVTSKEGPVGRSCQFRAEKRPPRPPPFFLKNPSYLNKNVYYRTIFSPIQE